MAMSVISFHRYLYVAVFLILALGPLMNL